MARKKLDGFSAPAKRGVDIAGISRPKPATVLGGVEPTVAPAQAPAASEDPAIQAEPTPPPVVPSQSPETPDAPTVREQNPAAEVAPTVVSQPSTAPVASAPVATNRVHPPEQPRVSAVKSDKGNLTAYMPNDLFDIAKARAKALGLTWFKLLTLAFDNVTDEQLIRVFSPDSAGVSASGMPLDPAGKGYNGRQVNLRATPAQQEWLTHKADQVGAPSRTALVSETLRLYFEQ